MSLSKDIKKIQELKTQGEFKPLRIYFKIKFYTNETNMNYHHSKFIKKND